MDTPHHTLDFALAFMRRLAHARIATWLCGGWAEELRGHYAPRAHRDLDLLYPAPTFERFDRWLASATDLRAIPAKRFSHKRALVCEQIIVEVLLLEPDVAGYRTCFFDGAYQLVWPHNTLGMLFAQDRWIPVASDEALHLYRQHPHRIAEAYQAYMQARQQVMGGDGMRG